jgi:hypothetical protein
MSLPVQVRQVNRNMYDVFLGNGWDNWTRVVRQHWGLQVVNGNRLSANHKNVVGQIIQDHPTGSLTSFTILEEQENA